MVPAVPVDDPSASIPAVTSLIYTPVFVNPTLLGASRLLQLGHGNHGQPGAQKDLYLSYGFYDGNLQVMLCGDAELPAQADLDRYADAGARAFLAAYGAD